MKFYQSIFMALFLLPLGLQADSSVSIHSINYPVWVERDDFQIPMKPGAELFSGDVLKTGSTGRAWLELEDGSVVKLGQRASFEIKEAGITEQEGQSVLEATFGVLKGAFRYTSNFFKSINRPEKKIAFNVGAITMGLRGTDVWGRSADNEDFVALLDGAIEVSSEGSDSVMMEQPLTLYRKAKGEPADPVAEVTMETVEQLAPETELSEEDGIASENGRFEIVMMSLSDPENIGPMRIFFGQSGYAIDTRQATVEEVAYSRIVLPGFNTVNDAKNQIEVLQSELGLSGLWIQKN